MWNDSTKTPRYRPLKPNPGNGEANRALNEDNIDKAKSKLDKESQKGKGKRTSVAYVGVPAHPGSGEEGDGKVEIDELDVCDSLEIASEEVYRKEDGVNDIISWQVSPLTNLWAIAVIFRKILAGFWRSTVFRAAGEEDKV